MGQKNRPCVPEEPSPCPEKASFAELENPLQRACVQRMIQHGATIRQVAGGTGLPKSNIARMSRE